MSDEQEIERLRQSTVKVMTGVGGPTICMSSGVYFNFLHPELTPITIEDLAYGLAGENRFSSQTVSRKTGKHVFYNVAQHCVVMSWEAPPELRYPALMHETGEAPCGDLSGPAKTICPDYKLMEKRCGSAIGKHFLVPEYDELALKRLDLRMLATEKRDLMGQSEWETWDFTRGEPPFEAEIRPWGAHYSAKMFIERYNQLKPEGAP